MAGIQSPWWGVNASLDPRHDYNRWIASNGTTWNHPLMPNRLSLLLAMVALSLTTPLCSAEPDAFVRIVAPALKQHCGKCHGAEEDVEGEVNLLELASEDLPEEVELIRRIINVLDLKEMPPEEEPELPDALRAKLVSELKTLLNASVSQGNSHPRTPIRRMNRFQYNNAVMDLFDLKCIVFTLPERMMREHRDYFQPQSGKMAKVVAVGSRPLGKSQMIEPRLAGVAAFPQDLRAEHGFDNRADHLSLSPLLLESFLKLGQSITESPDFTPRNIGVWKDFFAPPAAEVNLPEELRRRLGPFLTKAFRRSVDSALLDRYVQFVTHQVDAGTSFPQAMKAVAAATIASPRFFYLYETSSQGETAQPVDDFELASRLSFFLWGSLPDQELLDLATEGELRKPEVLEAQFHRMLKDHKLKRFCDSFPTQWLQLERIISSTPNREKYPEFYFAKYRDSMHMMLEPLLLFETVLIENLPITQFIDSDFTYRSGHLEQAYEELRTGQAKRRAGAVGVLNFHRVPVTDRRNGGVITNAAVMTMTSGPERTQPITRGAWIAGVIFNNPPEPPPADVPPLREEPTPGEEQLTLRERLALHRKRADCKGCHEQIDPLGFALENYDPIGVWREKYANGRQVDVAGKLFGEHEFASVVEFKDAMLAEKDRFARGLAAHLLSFGLARELSAADQSALDQIAQTVADDDYKFKTLLMQVILSDPFQNKYNPQQPLPTSSKN